ncbi:MAG TPA: DUF1232 domain-containing protein [Thermomicrobiales bacterium]|jgi:uncharacterized membrane protein YkvA (DUF1232 family)|nr:DUF1232 domain-containing protein [Thermomicrobiales bacterium]
MATNDVKEQQQPDTLPSGPDPVVARFWEAARRLPRYLRLTYALIREPNAPPSVKAILVAGGAYTISPVDLVPGFIPVAGQLDDVVVLLVALRQALKVCPPEVTLPHLERLHLSVQDLDGDLIATRDLAVWLAARGLRAVRRAAVRGGRSVWSTIRAHTR